MAPFESLAKTTQVRFMTAVRLFRFLKENKMWWLMPMIFVLVLGFIFFIIAQSSPLGPFIYTFF